MSNHDDHSEIPEVSVLVQTETVQETIQRLGKGIQSRTLREEYEKYRAATHPGLEDLAPEICGALQAAFMAGAMIAVQHTFKNAGHTQSINHALELLAIQGDQVNFAASVQILEGAVRLVAGENTSDKTKH